jgi:hypothetical protein
MTILTCRTPVNRPLVALESRAGDAEGELGISHEDTLAVAAVPNLLDLTADAVAGGGRWCLQDRTGSRCSDRHG